MRNKFRTLLLLGCMLPGSMLFSQKYIADYSVAKEEVLRKIPESYINIARTELVLAYQHTSHGTHVTRGLFGLQEYKANDDVLFGVSETKESNKLYVIDNGIDNYAPPGVDAADLSVNETGFIQTTRNFLDAPENADVNVMMWSWCDIAGHYVEYNYLPGMDSLISEYGEGGSKIGTGEGQRELPVTFVFMTGHANKDANTGGRNPREQAALIIDHCNTIGMYCLDYYSIDTHAMDDTYYEDTGDNGDSDTYGGNFYEDWQNTHVNGEDYFENKESPYGEISFGAHNTQHITANRKAYAMWWILARIAGWEPVSAVNQYKDAETLSIRQGPDPGQYLIETQDMHISEVQVLDITGRYVKTLVPDSSGDLIELDLDGHRPGMYLARLITGSQKVYTGKMLLTY